MLAANITGNGVEDALESIDSGDFPQLFQLQEEEYGMCLDFLESESGQQLDFGFSVVQLQNLRSYIFKTIRRIACCLRTLTPRHLLNFHLSFQNMLPCLFFVISDWPHQRFDEILSRLNT
jgi:Tfp pilus assembly pilus retraction ATPase PilT